jgi:hypothetical protein
MFAHFVFKSKVINLIYLKQLENSAQTSPVRHLLSPDFTCDVKLDSEV